MPTQAEANYDQAGAVADETIREHREDLMEVYHYASSIPPDPDIGEQYTRRHCLTSQAVKIHRHPHVYGVETSFGAEVGKGGHVVTFNAEYDALPEIGHTCGHNLIATGSIASFLAVAAQLRRFGIPGRVRLLGTPAEEGGGGKVALIGKGAYELVDACHMAHPAPLHANYAEGFNGDVYRRQVACQSLDVTFTGKNVHAAFAPWQGINALDAAVQSYSNISKMRQQMLPHDRVHGVIKEGGVKPNIIPDRTYMEFMVRARSLAEADTRKQRVLNCFQGAATATGCEADVTLGSTYADMIPNEALYSLFTEEMARRDLPMWYDISAAEYKPGATDQGNVSHVVPSIHPNYGVPNRF